MLRVRVTSAMLMCFFVILVKSESDMVILERAVTPPDRLLEGLRKQLMVNNVDYVEAVAGGAGGAGAAGAAGRVAGPLALAGGGGITEAVPHSVNSSQPTEVFRQSETTDIVSETHDWLQNISDSPSPSNSVQNTTTTLSLSGQPIMSQIESQDFITVEPQKDLELYAPTRKQEQQMPVYYDDSVKGNTLRELNAAIKAVNSSGNVANVAVAMESRKAEEHLTFFSEPITRGLEFFPVMPTQNATSTTGDDEEVEGLEAILSMAMRRAERVASRRSAGIESEDLIVQSEQSREKRAERLRLRLGV